MMVTTNDTHVHWDAHHHVLAIISTFHDIMTQIILMFGGFGKISCGNIPSNIYYTSQ